MNHLELNNHNLVSLDLPGHGSSDNLKSLESYTIDYYSKIVGDFIDQLKLQNIILVGHSLGAHVATKYATSKPLIGLFNIQNTPLNSVANIEYALNQNHLFSSFFSGSFQKESMVKLKKILVVNEEVSHNFLQDFYKTDPKCRDDLLKYIQSNPTLNEISFLSAFEPPFKLIIGRQDVFCNQHYLENLSAIRDKISFIDNCAHYPMLERPNIFSTMLFDFIDRCNIQN